MAGITKAQIEAEIDRLENHTHSNYLKVILESYSGYNYKARLDIAEILYKKFLELQDTPENENIRRNLYAEIYAKMIQAIEDSALLAMMFVDPKKDSVKIFTDNNNIDLYNFLGKVKRGLSDKQILRIFGLKPAKDLLKENAISQHEFTDFEEELQFMINGDGKSPGEKARWKGLGSMYTEEYLKKTASKNKRYFKKSNAIAAYFNVKHAFKVLLPTDTLKKIWYVNDKIVDLIIVETYKPFKELRKKLPLIFKKYENRNLLVVGTFPVSKETLKQFFVRIYPQAQEIKLIAEMQLKLLDNPLYSVQQIRFVIYKNKGNPEPKPYEICPCGSQKKYKKCHRFYTIGEEDIIFNQNEYEKRFGKTEG